MKWSYRMCAFVAAVLASTQWLGSTAIQAEVINLVDSITADDPGWKYLYTQAADGRSVNPMADPTFGFAIAGAGGVAIWAYPETPLGVVPGIPYVNLTNDLDFNSIELLEWQDGTAPFHYGGVDGISTGTPLPQPPGSNRRTQYFVKDFVSPGLVTDLTLDGHMDDFWVVYLDGTEIYRGPPTRNENDTPITLPSLPGEVPAFDEFASTDTGTEGFRAMGSLPGITVSPGLHRLGVEVHQNQTNSSDMGMSIRLSGELTVPEPAAGLVMLLGTLGLGLLRRR